MSEPWRCPRCSEKLTEGFEICWRCGTSRDGVEDPDFRTADDELPADDLDFEEGAGEEEEEPGGMLCQACLVPLRYLGKRRFEEPEPRGLVGALGSLAAGHEFLDVYCCIRCGRLELYLEGIGEKYRSP